MISKNNEFVRQCTKSAIFRTKNWIEINDDVGGTCKTNSQIKFKTSIRKSSLCGYSDVYVLVNGTITIDGADDDDNARLGKRNKEVLFENCAPFTGCNSEIINTQIDKAKDSKVVIPMYNMIEYSNNYSKTSRYYRDDQNGTLPKSESGK